VVLVEVGPVDRQEHELGVGHLPQHEIGQALLAAGADQQIGIGQAERVEALAEAVLVDRRGVDLAGDRLLGELARSTGDLAPAAIAG
jgi:hypothetical protein